MGDRCRPTGAMARILKTMKARESPSQGSTNERDFVPMVESAKRRATSSPPPHAINRIGPTIPSLRAQGEVRSRLSRPGFQAGQRPKRQGVGVLLFALKV